MNMSFKPRLFESQFFLCIFLLMISSYANFSHLALFVCVFLRVCFRHANGRESLSDTSCLIKVVIKVISELSFLKITSEFRTVPGPKQSLYSLLVNRLMDADFSCSV